MKKQKYILEQCRGKTVLHVGSVGNNVGTKHDLNLALKSVCTVIGVDTDTRADVSMDVEKQLPSEEYDIVIAPDIIEHLFNPGLFLDNVPENTPLIITTPNVRSPKYIIEKIRPDHTHWHSRKTLTQLLTMKGFFVLDFNYGNNYAMVGPRSWIRAMFGFLLPSTQNILMIKVIK